MIELSTVFWLLLITLLLYAAFSWHSSQKKSAICWIENLSSEVTFSDIGGLSQVKEVFQEIAENIQSDSLLRTPAILLVGPPGVGKTLLCQALATHVKGNFYATSSAEILKENLFGLSSPVHRLTHLWETAKANAPSVIFLDEIQLLLTEKKTNTLLLTLLDGIRSVKKTGLQTTNAKDKVVLVATTHHLGAVDPGLLRAGRFDNVFNLSLPKLKERLEILQLHANKSQIVTEEKLDWKRIAEKTSGCSGADLGLIVRETAWLARDEKKGPVDQKALDEIVRTCILGKKETVIQDEKLRFRVAIHEAGHVVMFKCVEDFLAQHSSFQEVTIVSHGAFAGVTLFNKTVEDDFMLQRRVGEDDTLFLTSDQVEAVIQVLMAGMEAEKMFLHSPSSAAVGDLDQIRAAVSYYFSSLSYQKKTNRLQNKLYRKLCKKVKLELQKHSVVLKKIADKLLEVETLSKEEVQAIWIEGKTE